MLDAHGPTQQAKRGRPPRRAAAAPPHYYSPNDLSVRWGCALSTVGRVARRHNLTRLCLGQGRNGMVRYPRSEVEAPIGHVSRRIGDTGPAVAREDDDGTAAQPWKPSGAHDESRYGPRDNDASRRPAPMLSVDDAADAPISAPPKLVEHEVGNGQDEDDDAPLDVPAERRRVRTDKSDVPVETLHKWVARGKLDLQPEFQRQFVWNRTKASRLIESLILDIPIPVIYVAEEADGKQLVVDGQQRLTSICSFIDGWFPSGEEFRLGSLQVMRELNGKGFRQLDAPTQERLLGSLLRLIVIGKDSNADVKFEIFERLNLGAEKLTDAELRNSMYRGSYNRLLKELASNPHMLKVMRTDAPHPRMADRQLILRYFAMRRNTHLKYRGPMKQWLNREMEAHRNPQDRELDEMRASFTQAIELARIVFGDAAFCRCVAGNDADPNGGWIHKLNVALWDTVLYTFGFYEKRQIVPIADQVREELLDLMTNDPTFVDYIARTTDKPDRIRYRADEWRRRLDRLVDTAGEPRVFTLAFKERLFHANPTCQLCGQRIHDLDDAEVDHIEHYWRGGRTLPQNARLAHRYCNRARR